MTVLVIADDEGLFAKLPTERADLLISCGDLPDELILRVADRCRCAKIFAVKGNHDGSGEFPAPIINLHQKIVTYQGLTFGGFCGSWKYKPRGNYLFEQAEVDQALAFFPHVDIFVAHNSPRLTHDRDDEVHLGFSAFVSYVERTKPRWLLHGHQHLQIESMLCATRVIGTYGHRFLVVAE
jgi:Icc-related predicted phosphoesterase